MYKPQNLNEYVLLINDANFEMEEMIYCAQDELDQDMNGMSQSYQTTLDELKKFQTAVKSGDIVPGESKDEGFMQLAAKMQSACSASA